MAQTRSSQSTRKAKAATERSPAGNVQVDSGDTRRSIRASMSIRLRAWRARIDGFMLRRPHRSFRRTRRRDYVRSLALPGYVSLTLRVGAELRAHWKTFTLLVVGYGLLMVVLGGVTSQDSYAQVSQLLKESSSTLAAGGWDKVGQAGLLLVATFAGGPSDLSTDQQIYLAIILLFVWLSTVWLLREYKLGRKPKLRDALYNSGAPFLSTLTVLLILLCQLLPLGVVALIYSALSSVGIVESGFGAMLFWIFTAIVASLVAYWVTSTMIALVVVTLPGMYPLRAMKAAGDLVVGRRLRVTYRLLWALCVTLLAWLVVMIPLILLTTGLASMWSWIDNVPIMPIAAALMSALSVVWLSTYVYVVYRKVVDDGAAPA